ncbi:Sulfatase-modifying factor enzyme 1 [uncultured archaeon]|nr:Sulfatase-modifying factor enzyme 1 [uncultured archaeon]
MKKENDKLNIYMTNPSSYKEEDLPVHDVTWGNVKVFIKKLNEKEKTNKYRLPSEAEWEYAARAGSETRYHFGDDESNLGEYAWYIENSGSRLPEKGEYFRYDKDDWMNNKWKGKPHPVRERKPNLWGLHDMQGNVWEWVEDGWHENYKDAPDDGSAWDADGPNKVLRGRSWHGVPGCCNWPNRQMKELYYSCPATGFRILRDL